MLTNYFWAWSLPWSMVNLPTDTPLEKQTTLIFFSLSQQVSIVNSFLIRGQDFACVFLVRFCICAGLLHAATVSEFVCISPVVSGRHCIRGVIHYLWLLQSFYLFFHIDPNLERKHLMKLIV